MTGSESRIESHTLIGCKNCHQAFCVDCSEPLSIYLPNGWVLIVGNDFCPDCSAMVACRVLSWCHSDKRR